MLKITLKYDDACSSTVKTYDSAVHLLESEASQLWQNTSEHGALPNHEWEYLSKTTVYFGEHTKLTEDDNSTFVEGHRDSNGAYVIYFGAPLLYRRYSCSNARRFFQWGTRLRQFVDARGREETIALLSNR